METNSQEYIKTLTLIGPPSSLMDEFVKLAEAKGITVIDTPKDGAREKQAIPLSSCVSRLCEELKKDEGYYYSWQANIAMAFKDEISNKGDKGEVNGWEGYMITSEQLHKIANQAAKNFLDVLVKVNSYTEEDRQKISEERNKKVETPGTYPITPKECFSQDSKNQ